MLGELQFERILQNGKDAQEVQVSGSELCLALAVQFVPERGRRDTQDFGRPSFVSAAGLQDFLDVVQLPRSQILWWGRPAPLNFGANLRWKSASSSPCWKDGPLWKTFRQKARTWPNGPFLAFANIPRMSHRNQKGPCRAVTNLKLVLEVWG